MVTHIHSDFMSDASRHRCAEKYWEALWNRLAENAQLGAGWRHPWLAKPFHDGNPVFSAVCESTAQAVQIIQHQPTSNELELTWWLDEFGEPGLDPVIRQLVISCALSGEAAAQAYELMWSWVTKGKVEPTSG